MINPVSLLFTGHMIDLPDRPEKRFPADYEAAAAAWIEEKVDAGIRAGATMGFSSAARGGDILFLEACHRNRNRISSFILLPFDPEVFVCTSVSGVPTGDWEQRFWEVWGATPSECRESLNLPVSGRAYEACNSRLLELASSQGHFQLIALWDGQPGRRGGTGRFVEDAKAVADLTAAEAPLSLK